MEKKPSFTKLFFIFFVFATLALSACEMTGQARGTKCTAGWKCFNAYTRAFQNTACKWNSKTNCPLGCSNGQCITDPCKDINCPNYCADAYNLKYNGACSAGSCSYQNQYCQYGCSNGACKTAPDPCAGITCPTFCADSSTLNYNGFCSEGICIYQAEICQYGCNNNACNTCTPNWQCTNWSTCTNSQQTRTCTDSNSCGTTTGKPATVQSCTNSSSGLRALADEKNVELGTQTVLSVLNSPLWDPKYIPVLIKECNTVLIDSEVGWSDVRPTANTFNFSKGDQLVAFAEQNHMQVQAHHLIWGYETFLPDWIKSGNYSREEMLAIMETHIKTVAGHYKGRIKTWTVVNEALYGPSYINNVFYQRTGPDYIRLSFQWARQADPNATLLYNDNNNEMINSQSDHMYEMVRQFKQDGVPIDGVGMEMHLDGSNPPVKSVVLSNMQRFGQLGVRVYVTEFDVDMSRVNGTLAEKQAAQAKIYKEMMEACFESNACNSFMTFGLTDKVSWLSHIPGADPLPIDRNYVLKPAYYEMQNTLSALP